jgi:hypothetical protein
MFDKIPLTFSTLWMASAKVTLLTPYSQAEPAGHTISM